MHQTIGYQLEGENPSTVTITPGVWIRWERRFKTKIGALSGGNLGYEDLAYLAYEAAKIAGDIKSATFDQFVDRLVALDTDGMDGNPTNPAASDD